MFKLNYRFFDEAGEGGAGGTSGGSKGDADSFNWMDTLDDDTKGYVANKGFKDINAVVKSYQHIEKKLGGDAESLVRIPGESASADEVNQFYNKIGRPETADQYEFPEGDKAFQDRLKNIFHGAGVTGKQAQHIVAEYDKYATEVAQQQQESMQLKITEGDRELRTEWGAAYDKNEDLAARAAVALGVTPDQITGLEETMGHAAVMKMFHNIGSKISEDDFEGGNRPNGALSPAEAKQMIAELKSNKEFSSRLLGGDEEAQRKMNELHKMAYSSY